MSAAAAAIKATSENRNKKANQNSTAKRHVYPPPYDLSRNWGQQTGFPGHTNERYATMYIASREKTMRIADINRILILANHLAIRKPAPLWVI
jgi:hypothetical protein